MSIYIYLYLYLCIYIYTYLYMLLYCSLCNWVRGLCFVWVLSELHSDSEA